VTDALGSQGAVCSGGRYDGLVEKLGGKSTPAIGWAMGVERLVMLYNECGGATPDNSPDLYVVAVGDAALKLGLELAEDLRDQVASCQVEMNLGGGSFKSQMKRADKSGAQYALVLGEDEVEKKQAGLKPLRSTEDQITVPLADLAATLAERTKD